MMPDEYISQTWDYFVKGHNSSSGTYFVESKFFLQNNICPLLKQGRWFTLYKAKNY